MKILSPLFITLLLVHGLKAQLEDTTVTIEVVEDSNILVDNDSEPCNGYPHYRHLPINQAFYLGSHQSKNSITQMLNDGLRYLNIDICQKESPEQFFVIQFGSTETQDTKQVEGVIDKVCKIHTDLTAGTDEYKDRECPFIYKHKGGPWPSIGKLVNYNPDQAQWEGDGELVGVRSKILFAASSALVDASGYNSAYFTAPFWRDFQTSGDQLRQELNKECRVPTGGIKLDINDNTPENIEGLLLDRTGCNLNDSPLNTYISIVSVDNYKKNNSYLKELKDRLMDLNFAKWNGKYELLKPSSFEARKIQRDEL